MKKFEKSAKEYATGQIYSSRVDLESNNTFNIARSIARSLTVIAQVALHMMLDDDSPDAELDKSIKR